MANEIKVFLVIDDGKAQKQLQSFESDGAKQGQKIGQAISVNMTSGLERSLGSMKAALLGLAGIVGSALAFRSIVKEASQAEDALNDFTSALRVSGQLSQGAVDDFTSYAKTLQATTTASDDLIIKNASLLVSLGHLSGQGLKDATKAALDLSAGLNIDVSQAFDLVAKASTGATGALSRYGIKVAESTPQSEKFSEALSKINSLFGGLAESKVNTFQGAVSQLTNSFSDFQEALGTLITSSPVVRELIKFLSSTFQTLTSRLEGFGKQGDVVGNLIKKLLEFGQTVITYVVAPLEFAFNLGKLVFNSLKTGVQTLLVAVFTLGDAIISAIIFPFQKVAEGMASIAGALGMTGLQERMNSLKQTYADVTSTTTALAESSKEVLVGFAEETAKSFEDVLNFDFATKGSSYLSTLQNVATGAKAITTDMKNGMTNNFKAIDDSVIKLTNTISKMLGSAIVNIISVSMQTIGAALIKGGGAFNGFLQKVLGILGDLAISIGTTLIGIGLGIEQLKVALFSLSGGAAIAAGLALIALGGALKALSGGELAGAAGGGGGGGAVSAPATGGPTPLEDVNQTQTPLQEQVKPKTEVVVNVHGNVLDRRQTGLELAEVISEAFGTQGVVIASTPA